MSVAYTVYAPLAQADLLLLFAELLGPPRGSSGGPPSARTQGGSVARDG